MAVILVVDDEQVQRELLAGHLRKRGHEVMLAASGAEALDTIAGNTVDVMITDQKMPGMGGRELASIARRDHPNISVVMVTAYGSIEDAVAAMKEGVEDYITKPLNLDELDVLLERVVEKHHLVEENERLKEQVAAAPHIPGLVYRSEAMRRVISTVARAAETSATVLITGESGTGKEVIARAIHEASARHDGPFIAVNSAAVPSTLIESELFGHEKGAFTGADRLRIGRFEQAHGGTLFLDEIGELPQPLQVTLLRILEERSFQRVGGADTIRVNVRIVAATNRDLSSAVESGEFRRDLFYRLNVVGIHLPPLRERREDIPALISHFIEQYAREHAKKVTGVSPQALDMLVKYSFPGNVRELANIIEQAVVLCRGEVIGIRDIPFQIADNAPDDETAGNLDDRVADLERRSLEHALNESGGNKSAAARFLGISERKVRYLMKKYRML